MRINRYFFRKHIHTLRKKVLDIFWRSKRATFEFLGRLPRMENIWVWFRNASLLKSVRDFFPTLYTRLIIRGEYTKRDFIVLFIVAFCIGVGFKTVAAQVITIGFDDYTLPPKETLLDLNTVQKKMIGKGSAFLDNSAQGGVCSE